MPPSPNVRAWAVWSTPKPMLYFVLSVDLFVAGLIAYLWSSPSVTIGSAARMCGLLALAVLFEEASRRAQRLRVRMATYGHVDLTSVWTFAGALVLPPLLTAVFVPALFLYMWLRHERSTGMRAYRQVFGTAAVLLSALSGRAVVNADWWHQANIPVGAAALASVIFGIAAYVAVNTLLILSAIYLAVRPVPVRSLLQSSQEVWLEVASLCLGGLAGVAMLHEAWLSVLVLPPMVVLQQSVLTKELELAATTDAKTGLLNAITWQQLAQRELGRAQRENQGASLLMIDMDNFKLINDQYGHLTGDAVLKAVGLCLSDELRDYDSVGRFGGEEFVALLGGVNAETAVNIANRVLDRIRVIEIEVRDSAIPLQGLSASIGIACYPENGSDLEDLLHTADSALYRAKHAGRDRVELERSRS